MLSCVPLLCRGQLPCGLTVHFLPQPPLQAASPACTELETVMMDWLGKMLELPEAFLAGKAGEGGGVIQVRRGKWEGRLLGVWAPQRTAAAKQKTVPTLLFAVPLGFLQ